MRIPMFAKEISTVRNRLLKMEPWQTPVFMRVADVMKPVKKRGKAGKCEVTEKKGSLSMLMRAVFSVEELGLQWRGAPQQQNCFTVAHVIHSKCMSDSGGEEGLSSSGRDLWSSVNSIQLDI